MTASDQIAIQALAERSHSSLEVVEKMYRDEFSQLESHARIKQYLPLLTSRRVRELLRHTHKSGSYGQRSP